jgi:radical SAM superfamily enzyme YgiQ (UPF0313 family)
MRRARNLMRDTDLVPRMRKTGCYQVLFGIEAGTDEELANINKCKERYTVADLKELVQLLWRNEHRHRGDVYERFLAGRCGKN